MEDIKDRFEKKATAAGIEIKELLKQHGDKKIGEITPKGWGVPFDNGNIKYIPRLS